MTTRQVSTVNSITTKVHQSVNSFHTTTTDCDWLFSLLLNLNVRSILVLVGAAFLGLGRTWWSSAVPVGEYRVIKAKGKAQGQEEAYT